MRCSLHSKPSALEALKWLESLNPPAIAAPGPDDRLFIRLRVWTSLTDFSPTRHTRKGADVRSLTRRWSFSLTTPALAAAFVPAIIVGTVDMIGSCSYQVGYLLEMIHLAENPKLAMLHGQSDRGVVDGTEGISIMELADMFPNEESAIVWFESVIWPNSRHYTYL